MREGLRASVQKSSDFLVEGWLRVEGVARFQDLCCCLLAGLFGGFRLGLIGVEGPAQVWHVSAWELDPLPGPFGFGASTATENQYQKRFEKSTEQH